MLNEQTFEKLYNLNLAGMAEALKEMCRREMAPFKAPRIIEFVPELPKTGQGKIDKRRLAEPQPSKPEDSKGT